MTVNLWLPSPGSLSSRNSFQLTIRVHLFRHYLIVFHLYSTLCFVSPNTTMYCSCSCCQMCNRRGINTSCYLDGYNLLPISPPLKTSDGSDWLAGTIHAYGTASAELYALQGYPRERIKIIHPPFLDNFESIVLKDRYDFVVMTLLPCTLNVSTNYLSPRDSLREILNCLRELEITRIAVKLKVEAERHYVQSVLDELNVKADILLGKFYF